MESGVLRGLGAAVLRSFGGVLLGLTLWAGAVHATSVPQATVLPGQPTLPIGAVDLAGLGYVMQEYIVSGTATSYREVSPPDNEGRWNVQPAETAPYVTRIVVIRPSTTARFNGTVVVEWLNVSGGLDVGPVWNVTRRELLRNGSAYVAVSAQKVGVEGGPSLSAAGQPLKKVNPERYGRLSHPGDAFSYDMFSQVGALVKSGGPSSIMGNLAAKHVIAVGESQSAGYLTTYVNAVDPTARVFDGFLIHSRSGSSAALAPVPVRLAQPGGSPPPPRIIKMRSDLRVPLLIFLTETDVMRAGRSGYNQARQPDTARLRVWEVAGTSHADAYFSQGGEIDTGKASPEQLAAAFRTSTDLRGMKLAKPYNNAPQHHYVLEAGMAHLQRWVAGGAPPPHAQPLMLGSATDDPPQPALDANGNVRGGIRSPWMDVPTSRLSGVGNSGAPVAGLYGVAEPFDAPTLRRLYPGGKQDYLKKFEASLNAAIKAGFILPADKQEILGLAAVSYDRAP